MGAGDERRSYPWWVRLSLAGSRTRGAVLGYFWMCLVCLPLFVGIGVWLRFESPAFALGGLLFIIAGVTSAPAALMYWLTIRWVDQHGRW